MARRPTRSAESITGLTLGVPPELTLADPAPDSPAPRPQVPTGRRLAAVQLDGEVQDFRNVDDEVKRGDLAIRQRFATHVMVLFALTNVFVMVGLGWLAVTEATAIAGKTLLAADRIVDANVVMTLLGATTVQLGTVIYTIASAIFPKATRDAGPES